jgi:23S rRNA pseudouridine1911/1915/1917 synthase
MAVREGGREATTHWQLLERYPAQDAGRSAKPVASLLACTLDTGRTHQIRVHLAHIGHPLIGDATYGPGFRTKVAHLSKKAAAAVDALGRQALHAYLLAIQHPTTGQVLEFRSELPGDLAYLHTCLAAGAAQEPSGKRKPRVKSKA